MRPTLPTASMPTWCGGSSPGLADVEVLAPVVDPVGGSRGHWLPHRRRPPPRLPVTSPGSGRRSAALAGGWAARRCGETGRWGVRGGRQSADGRSAHCQSTTRSLTVWPRSACSAPSSTSSRARPPAATPCAGARPPRRDYMAAAAHGGRPAPQVARSAAHLHLLAHGSKGPARVQRHLPLTRPRGCRRRSRRRANVIRDGRCRHREKYGAVRRHVQRRRGGAAGVDTGSVGGRPSRSAPGRRNTHLSARRRPGSAAPCRHSSARCRPSRRPRRASASSPRRCRRQGLPRSSARTLGSPATSRPGTSPPRSSGVPTSGCRPVPPRTTSCSRACPAGGAALLAPSSSPIPPRPIFDARR